MWEYLKTTEKPIVLYGTGNGAEKILKRLDALGIRVRGVFASDDFVRGKVFCGMPVTSYAEAKAAFGDMIVLVCFGTDRPEVIGRIRQIAAEQELYMPDVPVVTEDDGSFEVFDGAYEAAHRAPLDAVFSALSDEKSYKVLQSVIAYKKSGKIDDLFSCESPEEELWRLLGSGEHESYLDLGAYTGDTLADFVRSVDGCYDHLYAMEPDARNFRKLTENTITYHDCELHNIAVSDHRETLQFLKNSGRGSNRGGSAAGRSRVIDVPADSVDNILGGRPCSVIKFDVEGQEAKAIAGAAQTIRTQKPKLIVAAYHRTEDLFAVPLQILAVEPSYKVYLRHSPCLPAWEVNYVFV